jgi:anti-sigma-K factor RskA
MDRNTLLDLIPAYALGALDIEERAEVEALLATDAEAQQMLAEYQAVADDLILTVPARPAPAHLSADLRQRLAANRPQAANVTPRSTTAEPTLIPPPAKPNLRRQTPVWLPLVAAAAMVAIVVAAVLLLRPQSEPPSDPAQRYQWIVAQENVRRIPIAAADPALSTHGELVLTSDGKYGVIEVRQLPEIHNNQTYQLWLIDDQGAHSGGIMDFSQPHGSNYISLPLEKAADDYDAFGMSIEPEGGSPDPNGPTGDRVFGVTV